MIKINNPALKGLEFLKELSPLKRVGVDKVNICCIIEERFKSIG
ncbi:unnamed protein product, partial [marine sediment metagenome]